LSAIMKSAQFWEYSSIAAKRDQKHLFMLTHNFSSAMGML